MKKKKTSVTANSVNWLGNKGVTSLFMTMDYALLSMLLALASLAPARVFLPPQKPTSQNFNVTNNKNNL